VILLSIVFRLRHVATYSIAEYNMLKMRDVMIENADVEGVLEANEVDDK
jgi:hypothetical protein